MKLFTSFKNIFKKSKHTSQKTCYSGYYSKEDLHWESETLAEIEKKIAAGKIEIKTIGPEPFDFDNDVTSM